MAALSCPWDCGAKEWFPWNELLLHMQPWISLFHWCQVLSYSLLSFSTLEFMAHLFWNLQTYFAITFPTEQFCLLMVDNKYWVRRFCPWKEETSPFDNNKRFGYRNSLGLSILLFVYFFFVCLFWIIFLIRLWRRKKSGTSSSDSSPCLDWDKSCFRPFYTVGLESLSVPHWLVADLSTAWEKQALGRVRTGDDKCLMYNSLCAQDHMTSSCSPDVPEKPDRILKVHSSHLTLGIYGMQQWMPGTLQRRKPHVLTNCKWKLFCCLETCSNG